jgi:hypothetical protein
VPQTRPAEQVPVAAPVTTKKQEVMEALPVAEEEEDPLASEWKELPLEFGTEGPKETPDVDLDRPKD